MMLFHCLLSSITSNKKLTHYCILFCYCCPIYIVPFSLVTLKIFNVSLVISNMNLVPWCVFFSFYSWIYKNLWFLSNMGSFCHHLFKHILCLTLLLFFTWMLDCFILSHKSLELCFMLLLFFCLFFEKSGWLAIAESSKFF